jgi:hypothetical protein
MVESRHGAFKNELSNDAAIPHLSDDPGKLVPLEPLGPYSSYNLDVALRWAKAGLRVIPARVTLNEQTGRWNKQPIITGYQQKATTDLEVIKKWFSQNPDARPGILLTDLIVIDADRHGGPDGVAAFEKLADENGGLPACPVTLTASNGKHFYFRQPDDIQLGCSRGSLPNGVDVRGRGGWIMAPGAIRPDGERWMADPTAPDLLDALADGTIPVVPKWLVKIIRTKPQPPGSGPSSAPRTGLTDQPPQSKAVGGRITLSDRERAFAQAALAECATDLAAASPGDRNQTLNAVAYRMGRMVARGWIERPDVADALWAAAKQCGLVQDDGKDSVQATLGSGLEDGTAYPHEDLPDRPIEGDVAKAVPETLTVIWDGDAPLEPLSWLVRDLIEEGAVVLLVGESQAGKSFAVIYLAVSLGAGRPWFTKETKRGGTLILAAEAPGTIPERLEAARIGPATDDDKSEALGLLPIGHIPRVPNLADSENTRLLINTIKNVDAEMRERYNVPLRLVIIDSLISSFAISNWYDPSSISIIGIMRQIGQETNTTVLGVHHHPKDVSRGPAGSFALMAGPDAVISLLRDADPRTGMVAGRSISLFKSRRGPTGWQCGFQLTSVPVCKDADGVAVLSAFVEPIKGSAGTIQAKTKKTRQTAGH